MTEIFNYMFKDDKFFQKAGIYFLLSSIAAFLISYGIELITLKNYAGLYFVLPALLLCTITTGYSISCIKALCAQDSDYKLPFLEPIKNFTLGVKCALSVFLLSLILMAVGFLAVFAVTLLASILKFNALIVIFATLLNTAIGVLIIYYALVLSRIFAVTEKLTSYLQFKKAEELINTDRKHYLKFTGLFIGINILTFIITFAVGVIIGLIFPNISSSPLLNSLTSIIGVFIGVYTMFVNAFLSAKAIKS